MSQTGLPEKVLHLFISPIIMVKYTSSVWASALLTYISIVCVMSLNPGTASKLPASFLVSVAPMGVQRT